MKLSNPTLSNENDIFKKIFSNQNSLEIFQYSMLISKSLFDNSSYFQINFSLYSLTLNLTEFRQIFLLIEYTPNVKYLNIQTHIPCSSQISVNKINIKLEQLYVTLRGNKSSRSINFDQFINDIKQFSASLICLSLNLADIGVANIECWPFNWIKLQEFLESMKQLKEFHLYAKLADYRMDDQIHLPECYNQYWLNHNLLFGMHGEYLYTLPFDFDHLHKFSKGFDSVHSNNPEILINNPQIWYHVKSIELPMILKHDRDFLKQLKIKMPKLTKIIFNDYGVLLKRKIGHISNSNDDDDEAESYILDQISTIEFEGGSIEDRKDWIITSLPSIKHLILSSTKLSSIIDSQLTQILNNKIQQLDIYRVHSYPKPLTELNDIDFSNVQHVNMYLSSCWQIYPFYTDVIKILMNFKSLQTLLIYNYSFQENRVNGIINPCENFLRLNASQNALQARLKR